MCSVNTGKGNDVYLFEAGSYVIHGSVIPAHFRITTVVVFYSNHHTINMKIYSLSLLSVTPSTPAQAATLGTAQDLSSFSFYQRGSVGEFMTFFTKVCFHRLESELM